MRGAPLTSKTTKKGGPKEMVGPTTAGLEGAARTAAKSSKGEDHYRARE